MNESHRYTRVRPPIAFYSFITHSFMHSTINRTPIFDTQPTNVPHGIVFRRQKRRWILIWHKRWEYRHQRQERQRRKYSFGYPKMKERQILEWQISIEFYYPVSFYWCYKWMQNTKEEQNLMFRRFSQRPFEFQLRGSPRLVLQESSARIRERKQRASHRLRTSVRFLLMWPM